jgi:transposase
MVSCDGSCGFRHGGRRAFAQWPDGEAKIAFPAGTRVWIAGGVTDMRCGMNSLALKIQQGLGRDPHSGEIFCFRGRKADMVKLLWFDGIGVSLYAKRLEAGKFVWPSSATGEAVAISAAQLGYLLDGIDWRNPRWTQKPKKMG